MYMYLLLYKCSMFVMFRVIGSKSTETFNTLRVITYTKHSCMIQCYYTSFMLDRIDINITQIQTGYYQVT